jgi:ribonuclease T2
MKLVLSAAALVACASLPALAFESLEGYFIATASCEAYQSKNRLTNPGAVVTEPDRAYPILGLNKAGGDFFQIRIADAPVTVERWVHVDCGLHVIEAGTQVATGTAPTGPVVVTPPAGDESEENVLALSWQPAFCETRSGKTECRQLNDGLLPVTETQLSIHGLWPQPNGNFYCGVPQSLISQDKDGRWQALPAPEVDLETRDALIVAMPGTASHLERHEWIKHGTCYKAPGGADEYFDDTLLLTDAINSSPVGAVLSEHLSGTVTAEQIRAAFDTAFGPGAGARVQVQCAGDGGRVLISELMVHLRGVISPEAEIGDLIRAADTVSAGCPQGVIDPAGLQ